MQLIPRASSFSVAFSTSATTVQYVRGSPAEIASQRARRRDRTLEFAEGVGLRLGKPRTAVWFSFGGYGAVTREPEPQGQRSLVIGRGVAQERRAQTKLRSFDAHDARVLGRRVHRGGRLAGVQLVVTLWLNASEGRMTLDLRVEAGGEWYSIPLGCSELLLDAR